MLSLTTSAAGNSIISLSARRHVPVARKAPIVFVRKRGRIEYSVGWQWCAPVLLLFQEESHAGVIGPLGPGLLLGLLLVRDHGNLVVHISLLWRPEGLDRYSRAGFGYGAMIYGTIGVLMIFDLDLNLRSRICGSVSVVGFGCGSSGERGCIGGRGSLYRAPPVGRRRSGEANRRAHGEPGGIIVFFAWSQI